MIMIQTFLAFESASNCRGQNVSSGYFRCPPGGYRRSLSDSIVLQCDHQHQGHLQESSDIRGEDSGSVRPKSDWLLLGSHERIIQKIKPK